MSSEHAKVCDVPQYSNPDLAGVTNVRDAMHVAHFSKIFEDALAVYADRNAKYGNSWETSELGHRSLFVGMAEKFYRLKSMVWDDKVSLENLPAVYDSLIDTIVYSMFLHRKLTLELGPGAGDALELWRAGIREEKA